MTIAVLLRVLSDQADLGNVVGRAEVVETGESFAFRDANELTSLLVQLARQAAEPIATGIEPVIVEAPA